MGEHLVLELIWKLLNVCLEKQIKNSKLGRRRRTIARQ